MNPQIIESPDSLSRWLQTPAGIYLHDWESTQFDQAVADIFGYHGLQIGLSCFNSLRNSRISRCWVAECHGNPMEGVVKPSLLMDCEALPFPDQSLDLAGLVAFLKEQKMALQYIPERLEILDVMPATASGKIQKFRMREMLLQQPVG